MGLQEDILNIWSSDYVQKNPTKAYKVTYASEYAAVAAYLNGGPEPNTTNFSKLGKGLVGAEKHRRGEIVLPPDPPTGDYPASYFTGPLGNKNMVPAQSTGAFTCMWVGGNGWSADYTRSQINKRMTDSGRVFDFVMHQVDQLSASGVNSENWVKSLGSHNIIDWGGGQNGASHTTINTGSQDGVIAQDAQRYAAFGDRIMLRMFHEFNGNWMAWSATEATAASWIQAWKRVVTIFRDNGADNVGWIWCPTEGQSKSIANACYPGDEWCDWVSTTTYNGCLGTADWCSPLGGGWREYRELVDYTNLGHSQVSTYTTYAGRKPFVQTECGSKYDPNNPQRKGDWFRNVDSQGKQNMPNLRGIVWFDQRLTAESHEWRVDMKGYANGGFDQFDQYSYDGWKELVNKPRWKVGVAP